jgi:hypothetical protein
MLHPVPLGFMRLVCPAGAEGAPVSHGEAGYEAFRERGGDRSSKWLVDVPAEAALYFIRGAGFHVFDPKEP